MGQQQLLLIVLVMIAVGAAILVGMQVYDQTNRDATVDILTKDLVFLASDAMNFYRKPVAMGGGGQKFANGAGNSWKVPPNLDSLDNRLYAVSSISANSLEIMGWTKNEMTGLNEVEGVKVYVELNKDGVTNFRIEN